MKSFLFSLFLTAISYTGSGQIISTRQMTSPSNTSEPRLTEILDIYETISTNSDSTTQGARKQIDRWLHLNSSRLHTINDSTYDFRGYPQAMKLLVESETLCANDELSNWQNIGPRPTVHKNGWVSAVYMHPSDTNTFLIGARVAGIFKTTDHGQTWVCVTDDLATPVLGVRQIISSPLNPDFMLAVTGTDSGLDAVQAGYLISTDGGDTWSVGSNYGANGDVFQWFCFDPAEEGRIYAVFDKGLVYSDDYAQSWSGINLPSELQPSTGWEAIRLLDRVFISDGSILITNSQRGYVGLWKGEFYGPPSSLGVSWGPNLADSLNLQNPAMIVDDTHYGFSHSMADASFTFAGYNKLDYYSPPNAPIGCSYDTSMYSYPHYGPGSTGLNQPFQGYDWSMLKTNGWSKDTINGVVKLTCYDDTGAEQNFAEAITLKYTTSYAHLFGNNSVLDIGCAIPRGAKLTVAVTPYLLSNNSPTDHQSWHLCNIPDFDYNTLFENVLYETAYFPTDTVISEITPIGFSNDFLATMNYNPTGSGTALRYFLILEFNANYDSINQPRFVLNHLDIRTGEFKPNLITVSNVAGDSGKRFFAHVRGDDYSIIYRTQDAGTTFEPVKVVEISPGMLAEETYAGFPKDELLASLTDSNVYYHAVLYHAYRNRIASTIQQQDITGSGHHPDYRSSYIALHNGADHILWGNDGGVAETTSGLVSGNPGISSINGDLVINMIYNLDVNDTSSNVLIGLQDNGSRLFREYETGWEDMYTGDGCVTMLRENSVNTVVGDPQWGGSTALNDCPNTNGIVHDQVDIERGEAYLGMRLEKFHSNDSMFVTGLNRNDQPNGMVLINTGTNTYVKTQIPGSSMIGAIAISQRNPQTIYVADNIYKGEPGRLEKLYKTTNGGLDSADWEALDPYVRILNGQDSVLLSYYKQWDYVAALAVDAIDPDLVYAGLSGIGDYNGVVTDAFLRVLKSDDGGSSFSDWSEGLPALPVNFLLTIESSNHLIFCANDAGVYYRMDGMPAWECFSNNLPKTRITDLAYKYCSRELYASTYGRGVWKSDVALITETPVAQVISANTTWNQDKELHENVVVSSGYTLTITSEVHLDADRKIIVEPGARLVLDGATLTNHCETFWSGIEVRGNSSSPQYAVNQGTLTLKNGATIEFARNAVQLWQPNNWSSTGGIVRATNATFRNNQRDVDLVDYNWSLSGVGQPNQSFFLNCDFITDNEYNYPTLKEHVRMYHVYGVRFTNCNFEDQRPTADAPERGKGILSLDAKFKVLGTYTGGTQTTVEYYNDSLYNGCTFTGLTAGVHAMNLNSTNTITLDQALFTDCQYGVSLQLVDDAMVTRNKFNRTEGSDWYGYQYDIYAYKSTGFQVEGNFFTTEYNAEPSVGVTIRDAGTYDNRVYRNRFDGVFIGSFAHGRNRNSEFIGGNDLKGLDFTCNAHSASTIYDELFLTAVAADGVKLLQGTAEQATGTVLSDDQSGVNYQLYSTMATNVIYNYASQAGEIPDNGFYTSNIIPNQVPTNDCDTQFDVSVPGPGKPLSGSVVSSLGLQYSALSTTYTGKLAAYDSLTQGGNAEELYDLIAAASRNNSTSLRDSLLTRSPYLSEALLLALADQSPEKFPEDYLTEILVHNIEVAYNPAFTGYLLEKESPMSAEAYQEIMDSLGTFTDRGVRQFELVEIRSEMEAITDQLVRDLVQDSLGADLSAFGNWVNKRNDEISSRKLALMYLSLGNKSTAQSHLNALASHAPQLEDELLKEDLLTYAGFQQVLLDSASARGTIEALTPYLDSLARYHASHSTGYARAGGQNLLCFFLGECAGAPVPFIAGSSMALYSGDGSSADEVSGLHTRFRLYPNPATREVTIEIPDAEWAQVLLLNMEGRRVLDQRFSGERQTLDLNALEKGMYLVHVLINGEQAEVARLVVQ